MAWFVRTFCFESAGQISIKFGVGVVTETPVFRFLCYYDMSIFVGLRVSTVLKSSLGLYFIIFFVTVFKILKNLFG